MANKNEKISMDLASTACMQLLEVPNKFLLSTFPQKAVPKTPWTTASTAVLR